MKIVLLLTVFVAVVPSVASRRSVRMLQTSRCPSPGQDTGTCSVSPEVSQGVCERPSSLRFIVNSCGDIVGPTMVERVMAATGKDISKYTNKTVFSEAWSYMATLKPDNIFLAGDNVYNDGIANWGIDYHPYGTNLAVILSDANIPYLKYHGYLTDDNAPGVIYQSYLEILKDKVKDGYLDNDEFKALREQTHNSIHVTWDDHDYLTNDPSNPHYLRDEFRLTEIEAITGWDRNYFRFGPKHLGIERTWTQELADNNGKPFLIRFIVIDEQTTLNATQGCDYYHDPTSPTGFVPRQAGNSSAKCPDVDILEDFEDAEPKRTFFGQSQLDWFKEQLLKPADLVFVLNGSPNFEIDYDYSSITEFPGEKRKFIELLRETGVEHVIFLTGDSHASYVTKAPNIVGYPLYTIVGSGLTQGLSYDRYIEFWGDISHRFLVAAGSTHRNNAAATFAEVEVMFDENGAFVRFTPHLRDGVESGDGWGPWYEQTEPFDDEPWEAQYDIRVSDLEISPTWPRYHYDSSIEHKFVVENIYLKWANSTGPAEDLTVTLTITNAGGVVMSFPLNQGANCGAGFFGFCKDKWGAFSYAATKVGTYAPSKVNQEICQHAGYVGDEIQWSIEENGVKVVEGTVVLKFRNTVLVNSDGDLEDLWHFGTQQAYYDPDADFIGVPVTKIIDEPALYGGFKVPVKGWDGCEFDDPIVQAAYLAVLEDEGENPDTAQLMAAYIAAYYPEAPKI